MMSKVFEKFRFLIVVIFFAYPFLVWSQDDFSYLKNLSSEDSTAINTLILYPKETRDAMFEASLYPEALVRLQGLQTEYNKAFASLMSQYAREEQEKYWDLVRYNGLVRRLAEGKKKTESEIKDILKDYPAEIHETALTFGTQKYETLVKINEQSNSFNQTFQSLIKSYPQITQDALKALVQLPEVLSILQDNISLVVLVGDAYRKNSDFIKHKADSLSLEVARQNAEDVKQWSKELEDNPQATEELKQSAKEYAKEYGYDEADYTQPKSTDVVEIHHYYDPYPYWCGGPWWYPDYWWYPYPYWYHWGFYFSDGGIIVFGLPSYFYVSWYLNYPIHHYYYPHLSDTYIYTHRHCHNTVSNTVHRAVDDWEHERSNQLPPGLLNDDAQRPERLKEYGKFEEDYGRYNMEKPDKTVGRQEFFEKNEKKYPGLNYPQKEVPKIQRDYQDDVYQRSQYPTKKEIENKTYDRNWTYPQKQEPTRKYYPDKKQVVPQQKQVTPQRKIYPQNNVQPQKKFIPQQQAPQRQIQPKSNPVTKPKAGDR